MVYLHENHLDDKVSQPLLNNGLVDAHTMLNVEDRQDIMLDMEESFAYQEDAESIVKTANLVNVDDEDDVLQFTEWLRGQHTAKENVACDRSSQFYIRLCSTNKVVTTGSTFCQGDTTIKHFA